MPDNNTKQEEMTFDDLLAVSGLPGLYTMVANRSNGLIVEELKSKKRRFASSRKHQFTPLGSIGIYTDDGDTVELKKVFRNMNDQLEDNPLPSANSPENELKEYFNDVLPNYDRDRVKVNDIKKTIKWFGFLSENGIELFQEDEKTDETSKSE